jgi:alkanesulfonate monooxygenase SsuD/methylene tetrahydromethanopterin reductase-like flavin-dependent oxidoreductase (luciferase family)
MMGTTSEPLRIGIQLPEVERVVRWPELRDIALAAEESGFDSLWVGDHLLYRNDGRPERGPHECWATLAAIAAITSRVQIGPLVACASFHPAAVLAKQAAAVHEFSGGRLILGLGAGWNEAEYAAFGLPYEKRISRFEEAFTVIAPLVRGERVTYHGAFTNVEDALLLPAPLTPIPMMIGSNGPRMLAITLGSVDAWNTWYASYGNDPVKFAALNAEITAAARAAGRDPATLRRSACVLVRTDPSSTERPLGDELPPVEGSPTEIVARLAAFAAAGADEIIVIANPINERSVREIGALLPALRAAASAAHGAGGKS